MGDLKVVIDLWNWYIKGMVFAQDDWRTVILAKELVKTKWMRKGKILDVDDLVYSINKVLDAFVKKLWWDFLDEIYLGISHPEMKIKRVSEQKRILDWTISQDDLDHISKVLYETAWEINYETIKIIPVQWIIDEDIKLKDPVGMESRKLQLLADVFMIPKNFYNSLVEVFEKLEVGIIDIIPNILWASEVVFDLDSKDLGVVLVDIGNNQTTYVAYEEGYPLQYGIIPIWAEDVTKDISIGMQIDIKEAEKMKREKWVILMDWDTNKSKDKDKTIDISFLSDVIAARYEEIFDKINEDLRAIDKDWKLPWWVALIWWGANMENLDKLAKYQFKLACYYGQDRELKIWDISTNTQFINILWVYVWSNKYSEESSRWFSWNFNFGWTFSKITKFFKELF